MSGNDNRTGYESFVVSGENTRKKRVQVKSGLSTFKFMEHKRFKFTPFNKVTKKYEMKNGVTGQVHSLEDIVSDNIYGKMEADPKDAVYICNKYIYVFQLGRNSGEVKLNCELKGISDSEMRFEKYNASRTKMGEITELYLGDELTDEAVLFYFMLSSFRLTDDRIKMVAEQIKATNGMAGLVNGKSSLPRVAGFNHLGFANYSPFNHIILKDRQEIPDLFAASKDSRDDKGKYFVYLTDMTQLSLKVYNKYIEAFSYYMQWVNNTKDEKAAKLLYITSTVEQMIKNKEWRATRFINKYKKPEKVEVPFQLKPLDLTVGELPHKSMLELITDPLLKKRLQKPDELFKLHESQTYPVWKKSYDEISTYYYQAVMAWGLGLLRIVRSEEFLHQLSDYIYGSHEGTGGKEFTLDDIETGKPGKEGFDKEEGHCIYSNVLGLLTSSLGDFPGTAKYIRKDFEMISSLMNYIITGIFDIEELFRESKNVTPELTLIALFTMKKFTAGMASAVEQVVASSMGKLKEEILSLRKGDLYEVIDIKNSLKKLEKSYQKELELLKGIRKENSSMKQKLDKSWHEDTKAFKEFIKKLKKKYRFDADKMRKAQKRLFLKQNKLYITEFISDRLEQTLKLDDVVLDTDGKLVSLTKYYKEGKKRRLKSDYFIIIREAKKELKAKSIHKSLQQAEDSIKESLEKAVKESQANLDKVRGRYDVAKKDYQDVYDKMEEQELKAREAADKVNEESSKLDSGKTRKIKSKKDKLSSKKKNLNKASELGEAFSIFNLFFEGINLWFAWQDLLVAIESGELAFNDVMAFSGSALDTVSSFFDAMTITSNRLNTIMKGTKFTIFNHRKVLYFSNLLGKLSTVVGIFSGGIDCYLDAVDTHENYQEGDSVGVLGKGAASLGGLLTVIGGVMLLSGGTGGAVILAGTVLQLGGTLVDNIFGSDLFELWLRHSCWGDEFGKKETTLIIFTNKKPAWAVVDFDHWAYRESEKESKDNFGWAGRLDAQIDSYHALLYDFGCHLSATGRIHAQTMREYNRESKQFERTNYNYVDTGYIELNLSIPPFKSPLSCFKLSIWLEDLGGGKKHYFLQDKKLLLFSKSRIEELIKNSELSSPAIHEGLKSYLGSSDYIFANLKEYDKREILSLQLIDSEVDDRAPLPYAVVQGTYQSFFDYEKETVIRVKSLKSILGTKELWDKLCVTVNFDVFGDGSMVFPQNIEGRYDKVLKLPLGDILNRTVANISYLGSNPAGGYFEPVALEQKEGGRDDAI